MGEFRMRKQRLAAFTLFVSFGSVALVAPAADKTATPQTSSRGPLVRVRPKVPQFPADVKALGDRLSSTASPAVKTWASQSAQGIARGTGEPETLVRGAVQTRWSHVRTPGASDTLTFIATYESAKALQSAIKQDLDSMSEMGEMESLRLQMAMDRLSKLMSTLSNLLKKASETASGITQNLK